MKSLVVCVVTLATFCSGLQLPSGFKKCDKRRSDFNQCLSDAVYDTLRILDKPVKSHGLPSLYDVEFPPDAVIEVGNSTYGLTQKFSRFRLVGLSKPQSVTARLDFGPVTSTLTIEASFAELTWECEYEARGTLVLLPLDVTTFLEYNMDHPTFTFTIKLEEYEKGTTYFRVIDSEFDMPALGVRVDFKQLFSNKVLNDEFNSAMTEKGLQGLHHFKHLQAHLAPYLGSIVSNFLDKVPVAELF
ncbi:hypothetical protein Zmor_018816 [Zophobas morio]|uniref:Uncharacterized protein n=1 Tax=Zophobas morio TaxID=2755281 RepID=A0AA38I821_9CUCU|nr:hypothetical protein Zmor_018816 [Zophobas morio]